MNGETSGGGCVDILASSTPQSGARFGSAISGSRDGFLTVGAPDEDVAAYTSQGRVYLFFLEDRDWDGDVLPVGLEIYLGTDPENSDTDGDDWPDGIEYLFMAPTHLIRTTFPMIQVRLQLIRLGSIGGPLTES